MSEESEAISKWLNSHGYPFELYVGQVLREAGWTVEHSSWYTDHHTEKVREIDVHAQLWIVGDDIYKTITFDLVIECKSSIGKPWVVFSAPRENYLFLSRILGIVDSFSHDVLSEAKAKKIRRPSFLRPPERSGHGIVRVHSDNKAGDPTAPFAALQSVMGAALAIGRKNADFALKDGNPWYPVHVVAPMVLLDGSLYEYSLDKTGQTKLTPVSQIAVISAGPRQAEPVSVQVVTRQGFRDYIALITREAKDFGEAMLPHAPEICNRLRQRVERVGRENAL